MEIDNKTLGQNIKVLREEKELSTAELSSLVDIDEKELIDIEKGLVDVSEELLTKICSHINIAYDEIIKRDIYQERSNALKDMKGKSRSSYNWYYGDNTRRLFLILGLIIIPISLVISYFIFQRIYILPLNEISDIEERVLFEARFFSFLAVSLIPTVITNIIFMSFELFKYRGIRFNLYFLFFYTLIIILVILLIIPFYIYLFYQLLFKTKGYKNKK